MNSIIEAQQTLEEETDKLIFAQFEFMLKSGYILPPVFNNFKSPLDFLEKNNLKIVDSDEFKWNYPYNKM